MPMTLPKEPGVNDRQNVILSNAERRHLRRKLQGTIEVARDILNPRNQISRFAERNTANAKRVGLQASQTAKSHAPMIGVIGLGALIFAARRPISRWISGLRKSKSNAPNGD